RWRARCTPALHDALPIYPARHSDQPKDVHREEGDVEADEGQPEIPASESFAQHAACDLGKPIVDRADQREDCAADQDIMEVGHRSEEHTSELQSQSNLVC